MRFTRALRAAFILAALSITISAFTGCMWAPLEHIPEWLRPTEFEHRTVEEPASDVEDQSGYAFPEGDQHGIEVLMLGRSVMRSWFDHWRWDGRGPYSHSGYFFYYAEVDTPPAIAESAAGYIARAPDGTVVVFKLCFADFEAHSASDVESKLAENLGYVRQVVDAAEVRGIKLILGNALPRVAAETTAELVDLHERYNDELDAIAAAKADVYVLDLYGPLVSAHGSVLARGLAISPSDSHLNGLAYQELDVELRATLERARTE